MREYENIDFDKITKNSKEKTFLKLILKGQWHIIVALVIFMVYVTIEVYEVLKESLFVDYLQLQVISIGVIMLWLILVFKLGKRIKKSWRDSVKK